MTPWQVRGTELIRRMAEDLKLRNLSPKTISAYTHHVGQFAKFLGKSLEVATSEDVRAFQLHLIEHRKMGWSNFNQAVCGLKFFYAFTFPRSYLVTAIPYAKQPQKLPAVLGAAEVDQLLQSVPCLKHRTLLLTLYAAGLRLSEASALTIRDIDSQRMLLRVACGKGQKERLVPMSPRLLTALREYWKQVRPPKYLFPGAAFNARISPTTIQKSCQAAVAKAGIRKQVTPHTLRHSYATGLLEAGVDLFTISRWLGHKSVTTTTIYLHLRRPDQGVQPGPLDWLPVRQPPESSQPQSSNP